MYFILFMFNLMNKHSRIINRRDKQFAPFYVDSFEQFCMKQKSDVAFIMVSMVKENEFFYRLPSIKQCCVGHNFFSFQPRDLFYLG
jgi:hypothetical protein